MTSDQDELRWETQDSQTVYRCPGFQVREDTVTFPDGRSGSFHSVEEQPAVVILAFTPTDEVIIIDEWRQAVGGVNRGLPAGTRESSDSDLRETAQRELREETGHRAAEISKLCEAEPANGLLDASHHYFVASGCEPTTELDLDDNESIRVETVPYARFRTAVKEGSVRDGRAILAISHYELTHGS